jgi:hypothetical protein
MRRRPNPEQIIIDREEREERRAHDRAERECPLEIAAEAAFGAWRAAKPEEARARAARWASANLRPTKPKRGVRAAAEALFSGGAG